MEPEKDPEAYFKHLGALVRTADPKYVAAAIIGLIAALCVGYALGGYEGAIGILIGIAGVGLLYLILKVVP